MFVVGCKKQPDPAVAGPGAGTITFAAPIGTASDFFVQVKPLDGVTTYSHTPASWLTSCKISSTATLQDMRCLVEVSELDLYFNGLSLNYNFPSGKCNYARVKPYFYYRYEPGLGPTSVNLHFTDGVLDSSSTAGAVNASVFIDSTGRMACNRDYSASQGPNCCSGRYVVTTTKVTTVAPITSGTTTAIADWGGKTSNCLAGPGVDVFPAGASGYPLGSIIYAHGGNIQGTLDIGSPISKQAASNVYAANFFADSGGAPDWPLSDAPTALKSAGAGIPDAQPWYDFVCVDSNDDIVHRIRVLVRSWTRSQDFMGQVEAAYNTGGAEPVPFGDQGYLDYASWAQFVGTYPGKPN